MATAVSLALARQVTSSVAALLVAASDLFSVFAGPTKALVKEDSPFWTFCS